MPNEMNVFTGMQDANGTTNSSNTNAGQRLVLDDSPVPLWLPKVLYHALQLRQAVAHSPHSFPGGIFCLVQRFDCTHITELVMTSAASSRPLTSQEQSTSVLYFDQLLLHDP